MAKASNPNTVRKHKLAIEYYHKLTKVTEKVGNKEYLKYRNELCLAKAAYKFFMEPKTLEDILYRS